MRARKKQAIISSEWYIPTAIFDLVRMIHLSLRAKYLFKYNLDYFIFDGGLCL